MRVMPHVRICGGGSDLSLSGDGSPPLSDLFSGVKPSRSWRAVLVRIRSVSESRTRALERVESHPPTPGITCPGRVRHRKGDKPYLRLRGAMDALWRSREPSRRSPDPNRPGITRAKVERLIAGTRTHPAWVLFLRQSRGAVKIAWTGVSHAPEGISAMLSITLIQSRHFIYVRVETEDTVTEVLVIVPIKAEAQAQTQTWVEAEAA